MRGRLAHAVAQSWLVSLMHIQGQEDLWIPHGIAGNLADEYLLSVLGPAEVAFHRLATKGAVCRTWDLAVSPGPPTQKDDEVKSQWAREWGTSTCFDSYIDGEADPHISSSFTFSPALNQALAAHRWVPYARSTQLIAEDPQSLDTSSSYSILDPFLTVDTSLQVMLSPPQLRSELLARYKSDSIPSFPQHIPCSTFYRRSFSLVDPSITFPSEMSVSVEQVSPTAGGHLVDVASDRGWGCRATAVMSMLAELLLRLGPAGSVVDDDDDDHGDGQNREKKKVDPWTNIIANGVYTRIVQDFIYSNHRQVSINVYNKDICIYKHIY